ncbi:MAG: co-chaperone GroES [Candidatus Eisenbacteria bacterium]|nr:co-chaperone GroES [Candidatus Eisenbacteria bacterium]
MKFTPLGDRVLIRALEDSEQKVGGIIIPDTAKEKPQQGEVVAAGPGKRKKTGERVPLEVKTGDRILYGKYSGTEVNMDGQTYLILHEDEILARL